jgi:alkanesulfonate monooxygenase SsuD/methylene tetrahydromethanopterin reductase-like flavin-dependent oxidoreductase (luciferase family)
VTNKNGIKFACYIYQQGLEYTDIRRIVLECERLGFDSVWLKDNFTSSWLNTYFSKKEDDNGPNSKDPILECWTTLSSLATLTKRIRLGAILVNIHRIPSVTAKMLSTLDVISNGRVEFGLSAGWYENEIKSYGLPFPKASTRIEMLEESIIIIKRMLTENQASFEGKHYAIKDAKCSPKPIQKPHPPIWIGGGGKKTLQVVAKYADGWNYGLCTYDEYLNKISILRNCCKAVGRDYEKIAKAWHAIMLLGRVDNKIIMLKNREGNKDTLSRSDISKKNSKVAIVGTPNDIIKEIKRYMVVGGVRYFTIHFPDLPDLKSLNLFAKSVIPHFRKRQPK